MYKQSRILIDLNTVMKPQKPYADSTLNNMKKSELIEYIRVLEYNYDVAVASLNQQYENVKDFEPRIEAEWEDTGVENSTGNIYRCTHCKLLHNPSKEQVRLGRCVEFPKRCYFCGAYMRNGKG